MNRTFISLTLLLSSLTAIAEDTLPVVAEETPGIVISLTDGSHLSFPTTQIGSIKFADGQMVIRMKDDRQQQIVIDDIEVIRFEDITAAIRAVTGDDASCHIVVTDLSGRVVYTGSATPNEALESLRGTFIISTGTVSRKVIVGNAQ